MRLRKQELGTRNLVGARVEAARYGGFFTGERINPAGIHDLFGIKAHPSVGCAFLLCLQSFLQRGGFYRREFRKTPA